MLPAYATLPVVTFTVTTSDVFYDISIVVFLMRFSRYIVK
ncbi:hypothetical protein BRYFOR_08500 [Marvinbryantia formatexigens DSM 14469]|uniref:Uncharacterized protein n=1 Tax=Marvinbryantia formatexigens DSM 14469 TaxID=478749 RepID=C6LIM2_9FIRM|nr:hypothetical protein BRYFOR_08500 [Marvinbryantia formatexigens DSM 14469]